MSADSVHQEETEGEQPRVEAPVLYQSLPQSVVGGFYYPGWVILCPPCSRGAVVSTPSSHSDRAEEGSCKAAPKADKNSIEAGVAE